MPGLALALLASACKSELVVGIWSKPSDTGGGAGTAGSGTAGGLGGGGNGGAAMAGVAGAGFSGSGGSEAGSAGDGSAGEGGSGAGGEAGGGGGCDPNAVPMGPVTDPITVPWQTGFENGVCDYVEANGYCYVNGDASYEVVTTRAHLGNSSLAVSVNAADGAAQSRCVRQGTFPPDAYYGAWFFVPEAATDARLWNLFLFQGRNDGEDFERLWDVSLGNTDTGGQGLFVFDHRGGEVLMGPANIEIPIGTWFHVELRLLRAADDSGLVALYQDDELLLETRRPTDDTMRGQWYVGNLADGRLPPDSTVYVDDVSIRAAP